MTAPDFASLRDIRANDPSAIARAMLGRERRSLLGALDGKVVAGSMNRGGVQASVFEMDDRLTAYDVDSIVSSRLDFAKLLVRINLDDGASAQTIETAASTVSRAAAAKVPIM